MAGHSSISKSVGHQQDWHLFGEAVDAIDQLLEFHGVEIRKALNPLVAGDQVKISRRFAKALKGAVAGAEAAAIKTAMNALDVDWKNMSADGRDRIIKAARNRIKKVLVDTSLPKLNPIIKATAEKTVSGAKKQSIQTHKLDIRTTTTKLDNDIVGLLTKSHANFITDEYGKRSDTFSTKVRTIVGGGLERGSGSKEIVEEIKEKIPSISSLGRGDFYWEVVALSFVNRARTNAQISAFSEAGIEFYIWESTMDEVTTEPCRFLDGKRFSVGVAVKKIQSAEKAASKSPEAVKNVQPWISVGRDPNGNKIIYYKDEDGQRNTVAQVETSAVGKPDEVGTFTGGLSSEVLQDRGLSMPPIHGMCRSTVVPDVSLPPTQIEPPPPPKIPKPVAPKPKPKPKPKPSEPKPKKEPTPAELAQAKLMTFKVEPGSPFAKVPLPDGSPSEYTGALYSLSAEEKKAVTKIVNVEIDKVAAIKSKVSLGDVQKIIQNPEKAFAPVVIKHNGKMFLQSGHAEAVAHIAFGEKYLVDAKLIDLDLIKKKPTPVPVATPSKPLPDIKPSGKIRNKPEPGKPLKLNELGTERLERGQKWTIKDEAARLRKAGTEEKRAITAFTGSSYTRMREAQGDPDFAKRNPEAKTLADAAERGLKQAGKSPGKVYRGIQRLDQKTVEALLEKPKFKLGALTSTSTDPRIAERFMGGNFDSGSSYKVMFRLDQQSGVGVKPLSRYKSESEILMSGEAEFEITNVAIAEGRKRVLVIDAKEVIKKMMEEFMAKAAERERVLKAEDVPPRTEWPDIGQIDMGNGEFVDVELFEIEERMDAEDLASVVVEFEGLGRVRPWRIWGSVGMEILGQTEDTNIILI